MSDVPSNSKKSQSQPPPKETDGINPEVVVPSTENADVPSKQKKQQTNNSNQKNQNQKQKQQNNNPDSERNNPQERNNQQKRKEPNQNQNKQNNPNQKQNQKQNPEQLKLHLNPPQQGGMRPPGSPVSQEEPTSLPHSPKRQEGPSDNPESNRRRQPKFAKQHASVNVQFDNPQKRKQAARKQIVEMKLSVKQCEIFSHLPQYERPSSLSLATKFTENLPIHPAIVSLGLKYANKQIQGSTARTISMIDAFLLVIQDYQISPEKKFSIDLDAKMKPLIQFLYDCKPISVGMGKVIKDFKRFIMYASSNPKSPIELKEEIYNHLKKFRKSINSAAESIEDNGVEKIAHNDVILVYGASHLVQRILERAHRDGKRFVVIVVDASPKFEGRATLKRLSECGITCHYVLLTALSYSIRKVTKVLFGAHSLLSNGAVVSRTGTAVVAMMAHANNIPVLVACETFKFQERAQLDSICWNAIENPNDILTGTKISGLEGWKDINKLVLLNLAYDVTPMDHISVVVSEVGLIPPTSVPVVLRESNQKGDVFGTISTED